MCSPSWLGSLLRSKKEGGSFDRSKEPGANETVLCREQEQTNKRCEMEQTLQSKNQKPEKMKNQLGILVKAWKLFPFSSDEAVD